MALPDAGFYLWAGVPPRRRQSTSPSPATCWLNTMWRCCRAACWRARRSGINPGAGRIRLALVAGVDECLEAAQRIVAFIQVPLNTP